MSEQLLKVREVADECRVCERTVCNWITGGVDGVLLKALKVGSQYRIRREWLDAFLHRDEPKSVSRSDPTPTERQREHDRTVQRLAAKGW